MHRRLFLGAGDSPVAVLESKDPIKGDIEFDTLDFNPHTDPDILHNLDNHPWPIPDEEYDDVHAYEVLEHLGTQGDFRRFFADFNEIWRILVPGGLLYASVPRWDDLWAWGDPGHTRVINEGSLVFLSCREPKPPSSDYRAFIKGWWDIEGHNPLGGRFFFVLRKAEPNV